ncbi:hypothetical protein CC2G_009388 [Coprinopsis cinerea AmutBmut pab1-1]|nr:hypothetical protein CC2G_009388 [Coprinopsis cinerea AmutBmut pab1-1]
MYYIFDGDNGRIYASYYCKAFSRLWTPQRARAGAALPQPSSLPIAQRFFNDASLLLPHSSCRSTALFTPLLSSLAIHTFADRRRIKADDHHRGPLSSGQPPSLYPDDTGDLGAMLKLLNPIQQV